jgi:hypothetical protein
LFHIRKGLITRLDYMAGEWCDLCDSCLFYSQSACQVNVFPQSHILSHNYKVLLTICKLELADYKTLLTDFRFTNHGKNNIDLRWGVLNHLAEIDWKNESYVNIRTLVILFGMPLLHGTKY